MRMKKGEMGIGTLILFIAFILVAAVAASVLVSTTQSLQNKALATGKATQDEVGTSMVAVQVYAEDGSSSNNVDDFFWSVKLSSGSEPIKLSDVLLTVNTNNQSGDYSYESNTSVVNCTNPSGSGFAVEYQLNGSSHTDGYLKAGDVAKLCFQAPRSINENEAVSFNLVPKVGAPLVVESSMPGLITDKRIYVFP